jgi:YegS/Rv2252/BmrU family lipid kinase
VLVLRSNLFILNPVAGLPGSALKMKEKIIAACAAKKIPYEIVLTEHQGHAQKLVLEKTDATHEWLVYACGGDGTLNEVVSAAVYRPNVAITHVPVGTGNDFIRIFNSLDPFFQLSILDGYDLLDLDVIRAGDRFCLNTCCAGFDARCAGAMERYRWAKRFSPKIPYNAGVFTAVLGGINRHFSVTADGESFDGDYALVTAMNGRCYGGGYAPTPASMPNDGLMDLVMVSALNLIRFATAIGPYSKGDHEKMKDILTYRRVKNITLKTRKPVVIAYDGEMDQVSDVAISILPKQIHFAVPKGVTISKPV